MPKRITSIDGEGYELGKYLGVFDDKEGLKYMAPALAFCALYQAADRESNKLVWSKKRDPMGIWPSGGTDIILPTKGWYLALAAVKPIAAGNVCLFMGPMEQARNTPPLSGSAVLFGMLKDEGGGLSVNVQTASNVSANPLENTLALFRLMELP